MILLFYLFFRLYDHNLTSLHYQYIMSTMLCNAENDMEGEKNNSPGIDFLESGFTQLPAEGRKQFKEVLQNLVSMQNTMAGADNIRPPSNENQEGR